MNTERIKKIPKRPRFEYVTNKAYELLVEMGFDSFPISPWQIIEYYSDQIECSTWSNAKFIVNDNDPLHLKQLKTEARVMRERNEGSYLIVYDDIGFSNAKNLPNTKERVLYTIMHELGHVFLRHLEEFDKTSLSRGGLSNDEYRTLEIEADYFAAEVFAPTILFSDKPSLTTDHIRLICNISNLASEKKFERLKKYKPNTEYNFKLHRNFNNFFKYDINKALYSGVERNWGDYNYKDLLSICRKCPSCSSLLTDETNKFCIYCGYNLTSISTKKRLELEYKLLNEPISDQLKIDINSAYKNDKLYLCPICLNHDFSSDSNFCSICGQVLTNLCINENKVIVSNAHNCPDCGSDTTFKNVFTIIKNRMDNLDVNLLNIINDSELIKYNYWDFIKEQTTINNFELKSALIYSRCFINDDDDIIIYTVDNRLVTIIKKYEDIILFEINKSNLIIHTSLEVINIYDL